jgi:glycosyltransferase involved in cell wall biosynthesis
MEMPAPKRMLMIAPYACDPPRNGGMVRVVRLRRELAKHFELTYVAPSGSTRPLDVVRAVEVEGDRRRLAKLRAILGTRAYHSHLWASRKMSEAVAQQLAGGHFDLVYCHHIYASELVPFDSRVPIVIDQQNVDSEYWQQRQRQGGLAGLLAVRNRLKVQDLELACYARAAAVVCVSSRDQKRTAALGVSDEKLIVAANGADVLPYRRGSHPRDEAVLGFLGSFDMSFNRAAARDLTDNIAPAVRVALPGQRVRVVLIGKGSDEWLRGRNARDVTATGEVDEPRPFLEGLNVFVAPLTDGAGTKLKVIEAMAAGVPVVGSAIAVQGLGGATGVHYVESGPRSYVADIVRLISDAPLAEKLGHAAHDFAAANFDWTSAIVPPLVSKLVSRVAAVQAGRS